MTGDGMSADGSGDARGDLRRRLHQLYGVAGRPTYRQLHDQAALAGLTLPTSTAHDLLVGRRRPRWTTVEAFVTAAVGHARSRRPPIELPAQVDNLSSWRRLYERVAALDSEGVSKPPRAAGPGTVIPSMRVDFVVYVYLDVTVSVGSAPTVVRRVARSRAERPQPTGPSASG